MSEQVMERRTALCRGCEALLTENDESYWVDADGFPVCIEAMYGRAPVLHLPLPTGFGLRGAPK